MICDWTTLSFTWTTNKSSTNIFVTLSICMEYFSHYHKNKRGWLRLPRRPRAAVTTPHLTIQWRWLANGLKTALTAAALGIVLLKVRKRGCQLYNPCPGNWKQSPGANKGKAVSAGNRQIHGRLLLVVVCILSPSHSLSISLGLLRCLDEVMLIPQCDPYIYMLPKHVVEKRLVLGELGYKG